MASSSQLLSSIREHLREQRQTIQQLHARGLSGQRVSSKLATLVDGIVIQLFNHALDQLDEKAAAKLREHVSVVSMGSFSREPA